MRIGRRSVLATIVGGVTLAIVDSGALSSESADRAASIDVVGDDRAYLRLTGHGLGPRGPLDDGETYSAPHPVAIGNLLTGPVDVSVTTAGGSFTIDGRSTRTIDDLEPGDQATVSLDLDGSGSDETDTVVVEALGADGRVLVDASRTITLEAAPDPTLTVVLCRGRSHRCVSVTLKLRVSGGDPVLEVRGAGAIAETNATAMGETMRLETLPATIGLEFDRYGSSSAGNWRVAHADGPVPWSVDPGDPVDARLGQYPVTIDPDATGGPNERVSVTISPP